MALLKLSKINDTEQQKIIFTCYSFVGGQTKCTISKFKYKISR